jgi:hypothetical protein
MGIGAAMGRAMLDRTLKTPDDIERELGVTFLGILPELDGGRQSTYYAAAGSAQPPPSWGSSVHQSPSSGVVEAPRAIRTNIVFMAPDRPYQGFRDQRGPAEGKTTVACCLAIAMAQTGQRVPLVDAISGVPGCTVPSRPTRASESPLTGDFTDARRLNG